MKERLKMIFDRIDIFVVCIVIGLCFCIVEAFLGIWNMFADCFFITLLATECCYILRCNEKLEIELIEAKEKLKDADSELELANLEIARKSKLVNLYTLLMKLWWERWKCERAKVNYCKRKITSRQLVDAMNHEEKEESEISDKIVELDKELMNELYK
ncbi:hypothetical protein F7D97_07955 [Prevotella copri]|uniref:Uncharacterized protein n=1 Tax=Segatella copri TaxID=165179 RepID=A0A6A7W182_9BACT|nr:hypothetical protein [Segatella copri]MQM57459.1 hypothetical protein [Segatella copri]MQN07166.1 hypothetical protein [Segatella copri]MQN09851.1 hypothetical protein [Segatella copri]MQO62359.1 hypothetical protein [Segatella copri]MQO64139.1 hypothetical protein [Segatella copri]